jgi:hypothetical protein
MNATTKHRTLSELANTFRNTITYHEVIPFIPFARVIDIECNQFYWQQFTSLPKFNLHIGHDFLDFGWSTYGKAAHLVIRSDCVKGSYQNVDARDLKIVSRAGQGRLLKALQARCLGAPQWSSGNMCSWDFADAPQVHIA